MAFAGKVYWVTQPQDVIVCWDSATGDLSWLSMYQPDLLGPDGGAYYSEVGFFGSLTLLPDGRILSRLDDTNDEWAVVFDADLSASSAEFWSATPRSGGASVDSTGAGGVYDAERATVWLYRSTALTLPADSYWWLGYDASGALVDQRGLYDDDWDFIWPASPSQFGQSVILGDTIYRNTDAFNAIDRLELETGTWERGRPGGGAAIVGSYQGDPVYAVVAGSTKTLRTIDDTGCWVAMSATGFAATTLDVAPATRTWAADFDDGASFGNVRIADTTALYFTNLSEESPRRYQLIGHDLDADATSALFDLEEIYILQDGTVTTVDGDWWTSIYGAGFGLMVVPETQRGRTPLRRYPPVNNGGFGPTRHWPRTVNRRVGGSY